MSNDILKKWRIDHGLTQKDMAERVDLKQPNYCKLESGEREVGAVLMRKIMRVTSGEVQPLDMLRTRVSWLKNNKPELIKDCEMLPLFGQSGGQQAAE